MYLPSPHQGDNEYMLRIAAVGTHTTDIPHINYAGILPQINSPPRPQKIVVSPKLTDYLNIANFREMKITMIDTMR